LDVALARRMEEVHQRDASSTTGVVSGIIDEGW
jgi:hypothetical protein